MSNPKEGCQKCLDIVLNNGCDKNYLNSELCSQHKDQKQDEAMKKVLKEMTLVISSGLMSPRGK